MCQPKCYNTGCDWYNKKYFNNCEKLLSVDLDKCEKRKSVECRKKK